MNSLPNALLDQTTVSGLSNQSERIETSLPVIAFDDPAQSFIHDSIPVFYLRVGDKRVLIGFAGSDGWETIEEVHGEEEFESSVEDLYAWVDDFGAMSWYLSHGGNPDAELMTFTTNIDDAPHFIQD